MGGRERVGQLIRGAEERRQQTDAERRRQDDQDDRGALGGVDEDPWQIAPAQGAVGVARHQHGVDDAHRRGLGRREQARVDPAQNDHRHEERRDGALEGPPHFAEQKRLGRAEAVAPRQDMAGRGEDRRQHQARKDAGEKERGDRRAGDGAVDDEHHRGRNHDPERAAGGQQSAGERPRVAEAGQFRHDDRRERRGGGRRRAGERAEERARAGGADRRAASHPARQRAHEIEQAARHLAFEHDVAGEDEERDRHHHEAVDARELGLGQPRERGRAEPLVADDGEAADRVGDRHTRQEDEQEKAEQAGKCHLSARPLLERQVAPLHDQPETPCGVDRREGERQRDDELDPGQLERQIRVGRDDPRREAVAHHRVARVGDRQAEGQHPELGDAVEEVAHARRHRVDQHLDAQVSVGSHRGRRAEVDRPDHQVARDLLGPEKRGVEEIAQHDLRADLEQHQRQADGRDRFLEADHPRARRRHHLRSGLVLHADLEFSGGFCVPTSSR